MIRFTDDNNKFNRELQGISHHTGEDGAFNVNVPKSTT